jgi:hypothetical protein
VNTALWTVAPCLARRCSRTPCSCHRYTAAIEEVSRTEGVREELASEVIEARKHWVAENAYNAMLQVGYHCFLHPCHHRCRKWCSNCCQESQARVVCCNGFRLLPGHPTQSSCLFAAMLRTSMTHALPPGTHAGGAGAHAGHPGGHHTGNAGVHLQVCGCMRFKRGTSGGYSTGCKWQPRPGTPVMHNPV